MRHDPTSWYAKSEVSILNCHGEPLTQSSRDINSNDDGDDLDPWPFTERANNDSMQSLGAGYLLGNVHEMLAERIFEPLFGTDELLCSKEGFTFTRPKIFDLKGGEVDGEGSYLLWDGRRQNQSDDRMPKSSTQAKNGQNNMPTNNKDTTAETTTSKKQYNRLQKKLNKQQRYKDISGLCHIRAAISFSDQTIDQERNGVHFMCYPHEHSKTSTNGDCNVEGNRIYANKGDVLLFRSDLAHAIVAPSLTTCNNDNSNCGGEVFGYKGAREFGAVSYCSMLPVETIKEYNLYSIPKHKMHKKIQQRSTTEVEHEMMQIKYKELTDQKLESYRTGMTGDYRPEVECWKSHRRVTMWNAHLHGDNPNVVYDDVTAIPPRLLQRPKFRLGAPKLTIRQAELYGLLSYNNRQSSDSDGDDYDQKEARRIEIERAVSRGVRFVEGVYKDEDGNPVGPWTMKDGKFAAEWGKDATYNYSNERIPICQATMEVLTASSDSGEAIGLSGQDKYLGGMASPCGRYIYGVPGHAKRLIQVDVNTRKVEMIGPEYHGEFKWLRGVEIPASDMGKNEDGSFAYPSGCCLALPCNSPEGCVLKVNPETSSVSTFITDPIPNGAETGWLYHGGSLARGYVYAIPASASRVMKIGELNVIYFKYVYPIRDSSTHTTYIHFIPSRLEKIPDLKQPLTLDLNLMARQNGMVDC